MIIIINNSAIAKKILKKKETGYPASLSFAISNISFRRFATTQRICDHQDHRNYVEKTKVR